MEKVKEKEKAEIKRTKECKNCGCEIDVKKWIVCPECNAVIHFKLKPDGRIGKMICHTGGWDAIN